MTHTDYGIQPTLPGIDHTNGPPNPASNESTGRVWPDGDSSDRVIAKAIRLVEDRMSRFGPEVVICGHRAANLLGMLHLSGRKREHFCVAGLDHDGKLLSFATLFSGTVDRAHVYPRELCRELVAQGATRCLLFHNHPSGDCTPSDTDRRLTRNVSDALALFGITIYDHVVVGSHLPKLTYSMQTEEGLDCVQTTIVHDHSVPYTTAAAAGPLANTKPKSVQAAIDALPSKTPETEAIRGSEQAATLAEAYFDQGSGDAPRDAVALLSTRHDILDIRDVPSGLDDYERARVVAHHALDINAECVLFLRLRSIRHGNWRMESEHVPAMQVLQDALKLVEVRFLDALLLEEGGLRGCRSLMGEDKLLTSGGPVLPEPPPSFLKRRTRSRNTM